MKKVTGDQLKILHELRDKQDLTAMSLGVLQFEYENKKEFFIRSVVKTKDDQRRVGEHFLKAHGLTNKDIEENEYTIDLKTGEIKILVGGGWKEIK